MEGLNLPPPLIYNPYYPSSTCLRRKAMTLSMTTHGEQSRWKVRHVGGSKQWWKSWIWPPPPNLQPLLSQLHRPFGNEGECGAWILICFCKMQQKSSRSIYWIHPSFFLSSRTDLAWVGMHVSCNVFANIQRLQWQTSAIKRHSGQFLISFGG